jgi:Na+/phosphate symporter
LSGCSSKILDILLISSTTDITLPGGIDSMQNIENQTESTPIPTTVYQQETTPVMSFGDWLVTMLIMAVPLLNVIMIFVWATDKSTNPNKANWAKATLVFIGINLVIAMFFIGTIIGSVSELMSGFSQAGVW